MSDLTYGGKGGQMAGVEGMQSPTAPLPSPTDLPKPDQGMFHKIQEMMFNAYMQNRGIDPQTMMQTNPMYGMPSKFAPKPIQGENVLLRESDFDPATGQWMKAQPGSVPVGMGAQHNLKQSLNKR